MRDPSHADIVHVGRELPLELGPPFRISTAGTRILGAGPLRTAPTRAGGAVVATIRTAWGLKAREGNRDKPDDEQRADEQDDEDAVPGMSPPRSSRRTASKPAEYVDATPRHLMRIGCGRVTCRHPNW